MKYDFNTHKNYIFLKIDLLPVQLVWAKRIFNMSQIFTKGFFRGSKVRLYMTHTLKEFLTSFMDISPFSLQVHSFLQLSYIYLSPPTPHSSAIWLSLAFYLLLSLLHLSQRDQLRCYGSPQLSIPAWYLISLRKNKEAPKT